MKILKAFYFLIGLGLLALVVAEIDAAQVGAQVGRVGVGFAVIIALYFAAFALDTVSWQLTMPALPVSALWAARLWAVRMVGEAFNMVMPAASVGGEPVKAVLLKSRYGIGYGEGTASLILARTVNLIALVAFLITGFALMMGSALPAPYKSLGAVGLAALSLGVFGFFAVQRFALASRLGTWLGRFAAGRRLEGVLGHVRAMDARLAGFYRDHKGRFAATVALALANWVLGVAEVYYAMAFLGHPISWSDAWIIEAAAQLVRTGTFFIPLSIGAQEGIFLIICGAITGSPALGVSVAVVRRIREVIWIAAGFVLGSVLSLKPGAAAGGGPESR